MPTNPLKQIYDRLASRPRPVWWQPLMVILGVAGCVLLVGMTAFGPAPECGPAGNCRRTAYYGHGNRPDTPPKPLGCGDGFCNPSGGEDIYTCPEDCGICGDGVCSLAESVWVCPTDCPSFCGDQLCGADEINTCAQDCPPTVTCGDGVCSAFEDFQSCFLDCLPPTVPGVVVSRTPAATTITPTPTHTTPTSQAPDKTGTPTTAPSDTPAPTPTPTQSAPTPSPTASFTPISPAGGCRIVSPDDVSEPVKDAVAQEIGNAPIVWVLCNAPPQDNCLPVVPSQRVRDQLSFVLLLDCNGQDQCIEFLAASATDQQVCFNPAGGRGMLACTSGCALTVKSGGLAPLANVPLWVLLLGIIALLIGVIGLIIFLLGSRRKREEEEELGGDEGLLVG